MQIKRWLKSAVIAVLFTWCVVGVFALGYAVFNAVDNWLDEGTADVLFITAAVSGIFIGFYLLALAQFKKKEKP